MKQRQLQTHWYVDFLIAFEFFLLKLYVLLKSSSVLWFVGGYYDVLQTNVWCDIFVRTTTFYAGCFNIYLKYLGVIVEIVR